MPRKYIIDYKKNINVSEIHVKGGPYQSCQQAKVPSLIVALVEWAGVASVHDSW